MEQRVVAHRACIVFLATVLLTELYARGQGVRLHDAFYFVMVVFSFLLVGMSVYLYRESRKVVSMGRPPTSATRLSWG